ncbi:MAG: hypothetical protein IKH54_02380 [Bacilli bacterium]|nr:hypothetical protein [Bacilli bacterium]MBR6949012.1 hypothetical protein [Bacilli bacterium]
MMSDKLIKIVAIVMLIATIISFIGMLVFI